MLKLHLITILMGIFIRVEDSHAVDFTVAGMPYFELMKTSSIVPQKNRQIYETPESYIEPAASSEVRHIVKPEYNPSSDWRGVEAPRRRSYSIPEQHKVTSYSHTSFVDHGKTQYEEKPRNKNSRRQYSSSEDVAFESLMPDTYEMLHRQKVLDARSKRRSSIQKQPIRSKIHELKPTRRYQQKQYVSPPKKTYHYEDYRELKQPKKTTGKREEILLVAIPRSKLSDFQKVYQQLFNKKLDIDIKELPGNIKPSTFENNYPKQSRGSQYTTDNDEGTLYFKQLEAELNTSHYLRDSSRLVGSDHFMSRFN